MMRLTTSSLVVAVLAILTMMVMWPDPVPGPQPGHAQAQRAQTEESPTDPARPAATARVELSVEAERTRQVLRQKTDFELVDVPLADVVAWLVKTSKLNIVLDARALEDVGVDPTSSTLSLSAKNMSYAAALRHLLRPHDLEAVVQREILLITSMEVAESTLSTKLYPVWDLARLPSEDKESKADYDSLRGLITLTIVPDSWDEVGGPGSIVPYKGMLTISQRDSAHEEIERLLESMRRFPRIEEVDVASTLQGLSLGDDPVKQHVMAQMQKKADFEFRDTPLKNVVEYLDKTFTIPILVDTQALNDEGVDLKADTVTVSVSGVTLRTALSVVLNSLGLAHYYMDEALIITSGERADNELVTRLYAVAPLIDITDPSDYGRIKTELDGLAATVTSTVKPDSWDRVGGPASVAVFPSRALLVCSQTQAAHDELERMLAAMQRARQNPHAAPKQPPLDPAEIIVEIYSLTDSYQDADQQLRLVTIIQRLLLAADDHADLGQSKYVIETLGRKLIVSHRRDTQQRIHKLLKQLGALHDGFGASFGGMGGGGSF